MLIHFRAVTTKKKKKKIGNKCLGVNYYRKDGQNK